MVSGGLQKLLVFGAPDVGLGPVRQIGDELPHPPVWIATRELVKECQKFISIVGGHGNRSLTRGVRVTFKLGELWITSTVMGVPGFSFAALVARVTPSLILKWPSLPRVTCNGGIPTSESTYMAICRES